MIENNLTQALIEKIEDVVRDFRMPVNSNERRCPTVLAGYLPPKRYDGTDEDYPFIVVRPDNGTSNRENTTMTVSIVIGCFTEDLNGFEDCVEVMTRIRAALASMPNGILDDRYILQYPITWDLLREQPYPQWQLNMETHWEYRSPECSF